MKYAIWFVRLLFASWMIPAGVNHFIPIFPQPMGSQPAAFALRGCIGGGKPANRFGAPAAA